MNKMLLLGMPGGWEWIVILIVILLLFGGSRLPQLAKSLGQSKRAFKEGLDHEDEEARLEKTRASSASLPASSLASVDDDELIAEARRREQQRAAEQNKA